MTSLWQALEAGFSFSIELKLEEDLWITCQLHSLLERNSSSFQGNEFVKQSEIGQSTKISNVQ